MKKFLRAVFGLDDPKPARGDTRIEYWKDHSGWNFHCRDGNYKVVCQSNQGYESLQGCLDGIANAQDAMANAVVIQRELAS